MLSPLVPRHVDATPRVHLGEPAAQAVPRSGKIGAMGELRPSVVLESVAVGRA